MQNARELLKLSIQKAIDQIRVLASEDELEIAFAKLERLTSSVAPDMINEMALNRGSLIRNKREYNSGKISYEEYFRIRTRIGSVLLESLDEISQGSSRFLPNGIGKGTKVFVQKNLIQPEEDNIEWLNNTLLVATGLATITCHDEEPGTGFLVENHYLITSSDNIDLSNPGKEYRVDFFFQDPEKPQNPSLFWLDLKDCWISKKLHLIKVKVIAEDPSARFPNHLTLNPDYQPVIGERLHLFSQANKASRALVIKDFELTAIDQFNLSGKIESSDTSFCLPILNRDWVVIGFYQNNSPSENQQKKTKLETNIFLHGKRFLSSGLAEVFQKPDMPDSDTVLSGSKVASESKSNPIVFVLYDQKEKDFAEDFIIHLKLIGGVDIFDMHQDLGFGDKAHTMEAHLSQADLVLCLVSPRLFAFHKELLINARETKQKTIVPILIRPVDWENTVLGGLSCLPVDKSFIAQSDDTDVAFSAISKRVKNFLQLKNQG